MVKHVVGFSGGIDSQACARWVLNRNDPADVILLNSDAGGNEHPLTTEFIDWYSENVHPVNVVHPIVADMQGRAKGKIAELDLQPTDRLTFDLLAKLKQRFPSRKAQFCTEHLKLAPSRRWMREYMPNEEHIRYSGVRRSESRKRRNAQASAYDDYFDCELRQPIVDWTKKMCFDYVKSHGEQINPLYTMGFSRVGCAPCINSSKSDILEWVLRAPEMIEKVRAWEQSVGKTFFPPMVPGKKINWIDEVVAWSKTAYGGKQPMLPIIHTREACESKYGLCE